MAPPPAGSSLFPYTTLFRSRVVLQLFGFPDSKLKELIDGAACAGGLFSFKQIDEDGCCLFCPLCLELSRSEEHTSELQSRGHLVCRLLLEKKKNIIRISI